MTNFVILEGQQPPGIFLNLPTQYLRNEHVVLSPEFYMDTGDRNLCLPTYKTSIILNDMQSLIILSKFIVFYNENIAFACIVTIISIVLSEIPTLLSFPEP